MSPVAADRPALRCAIYEISAQGSAAAAWAAELAALTRSAYAGSDPLPGLPSPDGAHDTTDEVERELACHTRAWVARGEGGQAVAALRVREHTDTSWEVRRVSVLPSWRGRGLARALISAVETRAVQLGIERLWLNAVVERCLAPVYARLGYRAVSRWPSEDKPMTETTLERRPAEPRRAFGYPWAGGPAANSPGLLVSWFVVNGVLVAVVDLAHHDVVGVVQRQALRRPVRAVGEPRLAGADLWPGAGEAERAYVWKSLARAAEEASAGVACFSGGRAGFRAHLLPRTLAPEQLYVIVVFVGVGTVFFELAYLSYLPSLVKREQLVEGNSKLGASESAADVAGPGLAGLLVQVLMAPAVLLFDAASYVVSVVSLLVIRTREAGPERAGHGRGALRADLRDGLRTVFGNVYLRAIAFEGFTYNFFLQFFEVLLLYYATKKLHLAPSAVGLVLSCGSVGGLAGAVLAPKIVGLGFGPAFMWGTGVGCATPLVVPLVAGPPMMISVILAAAYFVLGVGVSVSIIGSISLRQSVTPNELLGRMNAVMRMSTYTAVPLGSLVAGFLGSEQVLGPRLALVVGGIGLFLPAVVIRLSPIPRLRELVPAETAEA